MAILANHGCDHDLMYIGEAENEEISTQFGHL